VQTRQQLGALGLGLAALAAQELELLLGLLGEPKDRGEALKKAQKSSPTGCRPLQLEGDWGRISHSIPASHWLMWNAGLT
jgi:hypothetical protein